MERVAGPMAWSTVWEAMCLKKEVGEERVEVRVGSGVRRRGKRNEEAGEREEREWIERRESDCEEEELG